MRQLLVALLIGLPSLAKAQVQLSPDHSWKDGSKINWCSDGYGTTFCLYNGLLYAFNYTDNGIHNGAYPYLYLVNKNHDFTDLEPYGLGLKQKNRIDNFGYPGEVGDEYYRPPLLGPILTFQYQGRLWYYQVIKNKCQDPVNYKIADTYFECWAKMPTSQQQECMSYYYPADGSPTVIRYCAFQVDSLLCFISRDNAANQWMIQEYVAARSNNEVVRFHWQHNITLPGTLNSYTQMGGYIPRKDSLDHQYFILSFYNENGDARLWRLTPDTTGFPRPISSTDLGTVLFSKPVSAISIAPGTIKACRTIDQVSDKYSDDRMVMFGLNKNKSTYGYNMQYKEYYFSNEYLITGGYGDLDLSYNDVPSKAGETFQIKTGLELKPMDYTPALDGNDGYQSFVWVFYPDDNKNFHGQQFTSDQWRLDPKEIPYSDDLYNDVAYDSISDMWTLVGVIEGPPPVSVNWPVWNVKKPDTPVSTLVLENTSSTKLNVVNASNDQWTVGETMEFTFSGGSKEPWMGLMGPIPGKKGWSLTFSETLKYTHAQLNLEKSSQEHTVTMDNTYGLFQSSQDSGTFIYTVPKIKRYRYNVYPWWDTNDLKYPLPHSTQYLFRTYGMSVVNKLMPLSGSPFFIPHPNDSTMHDWKSTVRRIQTYIIDHDKGEALHLDWDNNSIGTGDHLTSTIDTTSSTAVSKTYYFRGSATFEYKNPSIFKLSKATGFTVLQGKYTNESSVSSQNMNAITCSLANLRLQSDGLKIPYLHEGVYLFTWDQDSTFWVYDSLGGSRPWYIAYTVGNSKKMIHLLSPTDGSSLGESELLYNWEVKDSPLADCRMVIANSRQIDKGTIIYQERTDAMAASGLPKNLLQPGKTYYWAVTGKDEYGQPVWSRTWSFTLKKDETGTAAGDLKASIYPNPGKSEEIRILVDPSKDEPVEITLFDLSGRFIAEAQSPRQNSAQAVIMKLPSVNLNPGIYFLRIRTSGEQVIRKVVIE